jgi:hypothetical protein
MALKDFYDIEGISTKLLALLGYSDENVTELIDAVKVDLLNPEASAYWTQAIFFVADVSLNPFVHVYVSFCSLLSI